MKTYIVTYKEDETIEMYEYILKKYWPSADMTVLGHVEPKYKSNFIKYESIGPDEGSSAVNRQLYDYFSKLNEPQFIFCVDDMPVLKSVDVELINYTEELLQKNDTIGRVGLTTDNSTRPHTQISDITDKVSLIENASVADYKLSATWSAWSRDYFLLYLNDYNNLWEWEINGSAKSKGDDFEILGYIPPPMIHAHMVVREKLKPNWYEGCINTEIGMSHIDMSRVDQQKMKDIYNI